MKDIDIYDKEGNIIGEPSKHDEIVKVMENWIVRPEIDDDSFILQTDYKKILAKAIEKIYDVQYLDISEVRRVINDADIMHPNGCGMFEIDQYKLVNAILKLAIPECKKCKELKAGYEKDTALIYKADDKILELEAKHKEYVDWSEGIHKLNEDLIKKNQGLEAKCKDKDEQIFILKEEIDKLKAIISRGETILESTYDDLEIKNTNRKE